MQRRRVPAVTILALALASVAHAQAPTKGIEHALREIGEGRYAQALVLLEAERAQQPKSAQLLYLLALCKGKTDRHEEAVVDATAAIEIDPEHAAAYGERAFNLFHLGQHERALADYDRSLELDPLSAMAHGERGDVLFELGRHRAAMAAFDEAIRLAPRWPNPHSQRGRAALAVADFEAARVSFARATELAPDDLFALFQLAGAQFDCGLGDEAIRSARRLCRKARDYHAVLRLGNLAWQLDRHDLAREELGKVASRGDAALVLEARITLGNLLLALGGAEAALTAMTHDAETSAGNRLEPWLALMRWCARWSLGRHDEASRLLTAELDACQEVGDEVRSLAKLLSGETSVAEFETPDPERGRAACPALFLAGWRALADGDEARGDALLQQCVATGAKDYVQWETARATLLRRHGPEAFVVGLGASLVAREIDGRDLLVVAEVDEEPPGAARWQRLQAGDVLLRVSDAEYEPGAFLESCAAARVGHDVHLTLQRAGKEVVVLLRLGWRRR